jgi:hypothetical protein
MKASCAHMVKKAIKGRIEYICELNNRKISVMIGKTTTACRQQVRDKKCPHFGESGEIILATCRRELLPEPSPLGII